MTAEGNRSSYIRPEVVEMDLVLTDVASHRCPIEEGTDLVPPLGCHSSSHFDA